MRSVCIVLLTLMLHSGLVAQQTTYDPKRYQHEPLWIEMMNDPQANYFEVLRAFRAYWDDRPLPREPFETEEMESFERELGLIREGETEQDREHRKRRKWKRRSTEKERDYAAEVRAFKGWMQQVKPWVQDDGHIISQQQQQELIEQQQRELKAIEQKNGK